MTERKPAEVFPPGDFIREELENRDWTQGDLAAILGRPVQAVNEILKGKKAITADTAHGLGDAFGTGAEYWLNLESAFRLSRAGADAGVARRAQLFQKAPVQEMIRRQWINKTKEVDDLSSQVLRFLEIEEIEDTPSLVAAARKSTDYDETTPTQLAWLYRAKHLAATLDVPKFTKRRFNARLDALRGLAVSEQEVRRVPAVLAELGIRFVVVDRLPRTKIDGAAFWINKHSPVIAVSLRYDRIDGFWHTLGHELGHIANGDCAPVDSDLVGSKRDDEAEKPEIEQRADLFASELVIPPETIDSFIARTRPLYSKAKINRFANRIGVHPGIIVGQLQYRGEIGYSHSREMLVKVRDILTETALTDGWGSAPAI